MKYAGTVHHELKLEDFPFNPNGGDDLLFYGRIHPDKGVVEGLDVAERTGQRLTMAGIVHDERYHRELVQPRVDGERVRHIGSVGGTQRAEVLGSAKATLHLVNFEEPFGLSVIEVARVRHARDRHAPRRHS